MPGKRCSINILRDEKHEWTYWLTSSPRNDFWRTVNPSELREVSTSSWREQAPGLRDERCRCRLCQKRYSCALIEASKTTCASHSHKDSAAASPTFKDVNFKSYLFSPKRWNIKYVCFYKRPSKPTLMLTMTLVDVTEANGTGPEEA